MKNQIVGTMILMVVPAFLFTFFAYVYFRKKNFADWKRLTVESLSLGLLLWLIVFVFIWLFKWKISFFISYGLTPGLITSGFLLRVLVDMWKRNAKSRPAI